MSNEKKCILVIDDDETILHSIERQLKDEDMEKVFVNNPMEGLRLIEENRYDLVLCDIMMKPINGIDVLKTIKSSHPGLPVIIITGFVDDQLYETAKLIGSSDFLIKPVRKSLLLDTIHEVLKAS